MADPDEVTLSVGGNAYGGWTSVDITDGLDHMAASFRLGLTERWPGQPQRAMPMAGSTCVVSIGGTPVVTGLTDAIDISLSASSHTLSAEGRSLGGQLIDCSAVVQPGSWINQSLEAIANAIAGPLGVTIVADASTAPVFPRFAIEPQESCWDAIDRMAKQRGLIGVSMADGSVHLVAPQPGPATVTLTEGVHPFALSARHDIGDRFQTYIAVGQASGNDEHYGAAVASPSATATDAGMTLPRTLVVVAEDQASAASLAARAQWEASVRLAKAQTVTMTLPGWRQPDRTLWQKGVLVQVNAPSAWINASLMVVSVKYVASAQGKQAALTLARPEAYTRQPVAAGASPSTIASGIATTVGRFA